MVIESSPITEVDWDRYITIAEAARQARLLWAEKLKRLCRGAGGISGRAPSIYEGSRFIRSRRTVWAVTIRRKVIIQNAGATTPDINNAEVSTVNARARSPAAIQV